MVSGVNEVSFPLPLLWEKFIGQRVTIEELQQRFSGSQARPMFAHLGDERLGLGLTRFRGHLEIIA